MSRVRILILTSSTGAGHDARAQAFAEWCFELYRHNVDVRIEQMLEKSSGFFSAGVSFYNWIQQKSPWIHKAFYLFVELLSFINSRSVSFGRLYYEAVLYEYEPHLVFSVHDCLNRGYFQLARQLLGAGAVRCATYCGEFSGGFGYSRNWVEPTADLYVSRTGTARDYAVKIGMPRERTRVRGHLMQPRQHIELHDAGGRAAPTSRTSSSCAPTSSRCSSPRAATAPTTTSSSYRGSCPMRIASRRWSSAAETARSTTSSCTGASNTRNSTASWTASPRKCTSSCRSATPLSPAAARPPARRPCISAARSFSTASAV